MPFAIFTDFGRQVFEKQNSKICFGRYDKVTPLRFVIPSVCELAFASQTKPNLNTCGQNKRGCLIKIAKKRKKADVLYRKVLSIRLLCCIIKSPQNNPQESEIIIQQ
jgi:hypothetical protein